jgi:hypothetical protein
VSAVETLLELVPPPPGGNPRALDWRAAEEELGLRLPADYVRLAESYGAGCFSDFLWLFEPAHPNRYLRLEHEARAAISSLKVLERGGESVPFETELAVGGLLAWGRTDNSNGGASRPKA